MFDSTCGRFLFLLPALVLGPFPLVHLHLFVPSPFSLQPVALALGGQHGFEVLGASAHVLDVVDVFEGARSVQVG